LAAQIARLDEAFEAAAAGDVDGEDRGRIRQPASSSTASM